MELIPFITFIKLARWQKGTNAQLRHELEKVTAERDVIADTCKRTHDLCVKWQEETQRVAAERDELQRKLNGYHCTARNTRIVDIRELDLAAHKVIL